MKTLLNFGILGKQFIFSNEFLCRFVLVYLVVRVVDGEVSNTYDDFVEQLFRGMLGAVPEQGADNVPKS